MPKKISQHKRQTQQPGDSDKNLRSSSSVGREIKPKRKLIGGGCFALGSDGIFLVTPSGEGEDRWEFVCSLLAVTAHTRDSKGENWGRLVKVLDPDGNEHELALPMEALSAEANEIIAVLMNKGLRPGSGRKARELLKRYLTEFDPGARVICVSKIGWQGDQFVLPNLTIGESDDERIVFQPGGATDHHLRLRDHWAIGVSTLGDPALAIPVLCSPCAVRSAHRCWP